MKVKMNTASAGPDHNIGIGGIRDVPEHVAVQLVGDGFAKYCGSVVPNPTSATVVTLDDMTYPELVAACKKAGLSAEGRKKELRARLKALEEQDDEGRGQPPVDENATLETPETTAVR